MNKVNNQIVEILGAPSDLGANIRGAHMGPAALRRLGLTSRIEELGYQVLDRGDLNIPLREDLSSEQEKDKFIIPIRNFCLKLMSATKESLDAGRLPVIIGGDHSVAIGSVSGVAAHLKACGKKMGLIWFDAHADINNPSSSPTGNIHGMPLAILLGQGFLPLVNMTGDPVRVAPKNVVLIGCRLIDHLERDLLRSSGITYFTMRDIDERGIAWVMEQAIEVAGEGTGGIHLSFDLDSLDPIYAPGVSTRARGGLSYREARLALEKAADCAKIISMDFVELNPSLDIDDQTATLCLDLIESALGKTIM